MNSPPLTLPPHHSDTSLVISSEGMQYINRHFDPSNPHKNIEWTTDYRVELPVRVKKQGVGSETPETLIQLFRRSVARCGPLPALTYESTPDKWTSLSFKEYYDQCCHFGRACLSLNLSDYSPVMILGFNAPEWIISFYGSMFARHLPIGMYTTYLADSCEYVANHCKGELVVVENQAQLSKYYGIIDKCPHIKHFVVYKGEVPDKMPQKMKGRVESWKQFMSRGQSVTPAQEQLDRRMNAQRPGNCATFIYTSGTTGMPKACMVSHDNCTWNAKIFIKTAWKDPQSVEGKGRMLAYLPMSHVASQFFHFMVGLTLGFNQYFPDPTALQNNLVKFLKISRPTFFIGVPRIWEKVHESVINTVSKLPSEQKSMIQRAINIGLEGTFDQFNNRPTTQVWRQAKSMVYDKLKEQLGLDQCPLYFTTAAPIKEVTRKFLLSINIPLRSVFGMSQTAAPFCVTRLENWSHYTPDFLGELGTPMQAHDLFIHNTDSTGRGQICMRGRTTFMGYYGNEQSTKNTIINGFVMSGDEGMIGANGSLYMTGRIKEIIITAGGQNVAPVPIQNQIMTALPILSQAVVIGDKRKFLSVLLSVKEDSPGVLSQEVIKFMAQIGSNARSIQQIIKCPKVHDMVTKGIELANKKALSNVHRVQKFTIIPVNFTVDSGLITPTMKLKRQVISKTFHKEIEAMYTQPKL